MSTKEQRQRRGTEPVGFEAPSAHVRQIEKSIIGKRTADGQKVLKTHLYRALIERFAKDPAFRTEILDKITNRDADDQ